MKFWLSLVGYQLVWVTAVTGAARGLAWPGIAGMLVYAACQLGATRRYKTDLSLMATATVMGLLFDSGLIHGGLARYAALWPFTGMAPAWILALWAAFSLTFTQSLTYLQTRLWLAALLGAAGGPLAYLGAARGWHVVSFADPAWRGLLWLGIGWALATPTLAWLARRWSIDTGAVRRFANRLRETYAIAAPSVDTEARLLSGGNLQRLILAREIASAPRLMVAVQPTRGLDVGAIATVHRLLLDQRQAGSATILISEDLDEILALADRVAVIYEGRLVGLYDAAEADIGEIGLRMTGGMTPAVAEPGAPPVSVA